MKKFSMLLCAVTLVFGMVGSVSALTFTLDSYSVNLNYSDPGLVVYSSPIVTSASFDVLEVGMTSNSVELFTLGTNEHDANVDDLVPRNISIGFDFSSPDVDSSGTGWTGGIFRLFRDDLGYVHWNNPMSFSYEGTGLFNVYLTDATFRTPGSAVISARVEWVSAGSAAATASATPVPEPSTILLLGIGLLGVVVYGRKRLSQNI
jgi:hypothetical protein